MNKFKRLEQSVHFVLIFLSGWVCLMNLKSIKYGVPVHYEGSWFNVGFSIFLAIMWSVFAISKSEE